MTENRPPLREANQPVARMTPAGWRSAPGTAVSVELTGGLLAGWQERNAAATLPHVVRQLLAAGNLTNFRRLLDAPDAVTDQPYCGRYPFHDSDVWKTVEGLVVELARGRADEDARTFYEEVVDLAERVQAPDGYLVTWFQGPDRRAEPWSDLSYGHEMYTLGHLVQAAVAASRHLGDGRLLAVARRFADLVLRRYGPEGEPAYCGHPEVEMALVELFRETGDRRYLHQARLFVDRRGAGRLELRHFPASYFQDELPLREMTAVAGHAVRMAYLAAGAADVALETGDDDLVAHLERLWDDLVATRSYLTGGAGARHSDEAFGDRYELPSERAYAETCAAIGVMQWGWRLFLATGRADVLDHVERVLHNAYAVATSADGTAFFYDNPLQRRPDHEQRSGAELDGEPLRRAWFGCPCCPPNVLRWTAQLGDHVAVADETSLTLALLTAARVSSPAMDVQVTTDLPWDGAVQVEVLRSAPGPSVLRLRIPAWASGATAVVITGAAAAAPAVAPAAAPTPEHVVPGWWVLERAWQAGDRVLLELPVQLRAVTGHAHLDAVRGAAAVLRGPLVLCVEQVDSDAPVDDLVLDAAALEQAREAVPTGPWRRVPLRPLVVPAAGEDPYPPWQPLERPAGPPGPTSSEGAPRAEAALVPYALWGGRGAGAMRVWLRTA